MTEKEKKKMKNNNKPDLTILQQIEQLKIQRMKEMRSNKNKRNSGSTTSFTPKSSLTSKDNSAKDENNKFKNGKYSKRRSVHRVYGKHCRLTFLFLLPLSNLFHCLFHIFLYLKHPNKSFFNPIHIFDIFYHTLFTVL